MIFDVEDYTDFPPEHIVIGNVEHVVEEIRKCRDPDYRFGLTKRQMKWYDTVTKFV